MTKLIADDRRFSVRARLKSFGFAIKGLGYLISHEHNFKVHLMVTISVVSLGCILQVSRGDWLWLIIAIASVLSAEAMNTAVERTCDAITPDQNTLIGIAKDVAAGAVLINACASALIGAIIFLPYLTSILLAVKLL